MARKLALREAHIYPALKRHFTRQGYSVYAELPAPHGGYVDLLAVKGDRTVAVELKLRFSRLALKQAARNRRYVWQSLVAVEGSLKLHGRTRSLLVKRGIGLLSVVADDVSIVLAAKEEAPGYSVREVFGLHLRGNLAALHEDAKGGVPTMERVSAYRELVERVRAAIVSSGGVAATEQLLEDTLGWNYFNARRAGLASLLRERFQMVAPDLWATPDRARPAVHTVRMESVVRTHDRAMRVILADGGECSAQPGDILWFVDRDKLGRGRIRARALVKFARSYPVKETPHRELRAGPAVFFPWRLPGAVPRSVIVAGVTAYRELKGPKILRSSLRSPMMDTVWQTLRARTSENWPRGS